MLTEGDCECQRAKRGVLCYGVTTVIVCCLCIDSNEFLHRKDEYLWVGWQVTGKSMNGMQVTLKPIDVLEL